tara:strand:+ start:197 stop:361 length:165 start_codon:yes stop_codon:yes gene_type:complete
MNEFERAACRVLGVILFGVLVILYLQLLGCTKCVVPPPTIEPDYIDSVDMGHYA